MRNVAFKCNKCGRCCKHWAINLCLNDVKKLIKLGYPVDYFCKCLNGTLELKKNKQDACVFLENNCCKIHKINPDSKPAVCKNFPYDEIICGIPCYYNKNPTKKTKYETFLKIGSHSIESGLFRKLIGNFDPAKPLFEQYYNLFCSILFYKDKIIFGDMTLIDSNTPPSKKIISDIERILYNGRSRERFKGLKRLFNMPVKVDFPIGKLALSDSKSEPPTEVRAELIKAISDKNNRVRLNWLSAYKLLIIFYFLPHVFKALENKEEDQMLRGFRSLAYLNSLAKFEQLQNSLDFCKLVVDIDFLSRK